MDAADEQVVRAELVRTQHEARGLLYRGVALMASVPVVLIGAVIAAYLLPGWAGLMAIILAGVYALAGGIAGFAVIVSALADHRQSARQLRGLDDLRKLPEARVVVR